MTSKLKLAAITVASTLAIAGMVGGATYALFTANVTNTGNEFQAGTLTLTSERADLPVTGPMFYTDNEGGFSGTGFWAPGDNNTRGLFVANTGSIDAKLSNVSANINSSNTSEANAFAEQATVTILAYGADGEVDATAYREIMEAADELYRLLKSWWLTEHAADEGADFAAHINQGFLNKVFVVKNVAGEDVTATVKEVYTGEMDDLLDVNGQNPLIEAQVQHGETLLMGYTVNLPITAGNELQNKEVKFNFINEFTQVRND